MSLFVWRLLRNRVPTKENLFKRRIVSQDDQLCVNMCDHIEIVTYLFLVCPLFGSLWYDIGRWLGIVAVYPHNFLDHLLQFVHIVGTSCTKRYILVMI